MNNWFYTAAEVKYLQLELTSFCNIACPGCERTAPIVADLLNTKTMTIEQIKRWFVPSEMPSLEFISFSGQIDEPASHPELFEILDYFLTNWDVRMNLNTNGSLKTTSFWKKLGEISYNNSSRLTVEFALDGLEDTLSTYRVGAKYSKVINNAQAYIDAGGKSAWKFIKFVHNDHQVEEARAIAAQMGFGRFTSVDSARKKTEGINTIGFFVEEEKVDCRSIRDKWLFVNYDGIASPCCYLGYAFRDSNPLESSLDVVTVDEYLKESTYLKQISSNWDTNDINPVCHRKCKMNKKDLRSDEFFKSKNKL